MREERKARLEALPCFSWIRYSEAWEANLSAAVAYYEEHGRVPPPSAPGGLWVRKQRERWGLLGDERKAKLEALPWWAEWARWAMGDQADNPDLLD